MDVDRSDKSRQLLTRAEGLVIVKANLVYIVLGLLLLSTVWNGISNHHVDTDHQKFFSDVRSFMERGGRFTANDGANLQAQIDDLKNQVARLNAETQE